MHDRPPARDRKRALRERRRLAQREYRRRFDDGRFTVTVEIGGAVVEMLIASRWLDHGDINVDDLSTNDRKKIAKAIGAMLSEAAKR
jgi:hypothetical protein